MIDPIEDPRVAFGRRRETADMMIGMSHGEVDMAFMLWSDRVDSATDACILGCYLDRLERSMLPGCFVAVAIDPCRFWWEREDSGRLNSTFDGFMDCFDFNTVRPYLESLGLRLNEAKYDNFRYSGVCVECGCETMVSHDRWCRPCVEADYAECGLTYRGD